MRVTSFEISPVVLLAVVAPVLGLDPKSPDIVAFFGFSSLMKYCYLFQRHLPQVMILPNLQYQSIFW